MLGKVMGIKGFFRENFVDTIHDKCYLLLSSQESSSIQIENDTIKCSRTKKLLRINIDNKLKFGGSSYQKVNRKLNAVARITNYIELSKR